MTEVMGGRRWTVDEVLGLAPDGSSAGAARRLSLSAVWSQAGSSGSLLWGKCQGSAREPYQVTVDLNEPSFRCTCPSRKHPCKHGLALLLLWAEGDGSVAEEARPADFAADWVQRLAARSPGAGTAGRETAPPDPEAQAKRLAQRIETMSAGIDEFERWLFDLVRQGVASARHQPFAFWDGAAARLVDSQMPGLADRVRAIPGLLYAAGADWADRLLAELARGYLAVSAWRRRDVLPEDVLADLRVVLGWSRRVDEVLDRGERVTDRWTVVGLAREEDDRLQSQRTWLVGQATGRVAVILDFAAAGASLAVAEVLGSAVEAELALYPGSEPRRALFTGERSVVDSTGRVPATGVESALDQVATWVAANPFADRFPISLAGVVPVVDSSRRLVAEPGGAALPLSGSRDWLSLLGLSGGEPVDLFGEWDGFTLNPLSVCAEGALVSL
jgi:hypothetical protein